MERDCCCAIGRKLPTLNRLSRFERAPKRLQGCYAGVRPPGDRADHAPDTMYAQPNMFLINAQKAFQPLGVLSVVYRAKSRHSPHRFASIKPRTSERRIDA